MLSPHRLAALLANRAVHIRNCHAVAVASNRQMVAGGLDELAALYRETVDAMVRPETARPAALGGLVDRLYRRASQLQQAAGNGGANADEMRSLAAIYLGEAAHLGDTHAKAA